MAACTHADTRKVQDHLYIEKSGQREDIGLLFFEYAGWRCAAAVEVKNMDVLSGRGAWITNMATQI